MFEPQEIRSEHKDVIHDVLYDYYGQRIATCSSDQTVKVGYLKSNYVLEFIILKCFLHFNRFGIKMKRAFGSFQQVGKLTLDQFGVYRGLILNLELF